MRKGFVGVAVVFILRRRILHNLPLERCLQLRRDHRQPVDEQDQVETVIVLFAVVDLPHHTEDIGLNTGGVISGWK